MDKKKLAAAFIIPSFKLFLVHTNTPMVWKLPNILCQCTTDGNLKYWALKNEDSYTLDTEVYPLMLPHHYINGTVCYGSFKTKKVEIHNMLDYAISYLNTQSTHQTTKNLIQSGLNTLTYKIHEDSVGTMRKVL